MCNERSKNLFSFDSIDVLAEHIATVVGPIASVRLHNRGRRQEDQSTQISPERMQHFLLRAVPHVGIGDPAAVVPSRDSPAAQHKFCIASGAHHFHVLGRSKCLRGSNFAVAGTGRDVGHQRPDGDQQRTCGALSKVSSSNLFNQKLLLERH